MSLPINRAMLNSSFPKLVQEQVGNSYFISKEISDVILAGNEGFDTGGGEYRKQPIFCDEIWLKLERLGISPAMLSDASVLEVCAGTGLLTYHLLSKSRPKYLAVNDISKNELNFASKFIQESYPDYSVDWIQGDMHSIEFGQQFDYIIGNSFLHHFYNVPKVLSRIASMLKPGGQFICLHEPTPISTVVESSKFFVWPLAIFAPKYINDIARERYKGKPSSTDLWLFEADMLAKECLIAGFKNASITPWGLCRAIIVQCLRLHLSEIKPALTNDEIYYLRCGIKLDSFLNRILPIRCFGAISLICRR